MTFSPSGTSNCFSSQSQIDLNNTVFTPAAALTTDIGLCQIYENNQKVRTVLNS